VINVDKNPTYQLAFDALQALGEVPEGCQLRPVKYLNNILEQDHRFIKRRVRAGLCFKGFLSAWPTIQGYEAMHLLRKGQVEGTSRGDVLSQNRFLARSFGLAWPPAWQLGHCLTAWPPDRLTAWPPDRLTAWPPDRLTAWLTSSNCYCLIISDYPIDADAAAGCAAHMGLGIWDWGTEKGEEH
jgi:DDE domain